MKNNADLIILSVIIITAFAIFSVRAYESLKKKSKKKRNEKKAMYKAVINTLADMETDGVYFSRERITPPLSKDYIQKFKKNINKVNK